jgi:hypothetical protein
VNLAGPTRSVLLQEVCRVAFSAIRDSIGVSISACHAEDPGSIPGRGVFLFPPSEDRRDRDSLGGTVARALLAQWLERAAVNRKVTGSIPVGSVFQFSFPFFAEQWAEIRFVKSIVLRPRIELGTSRV